VFKAINSAFEGFDIRNDGSILSFGFEFEDGYILMSRTTLNDIEEDEGVYFEWNDQFQSGYDLVESLSLDGDTIELTLSRALNGIDGFSIRIARRSDNLVQAIRQIFRGYEDRYSIDP
jgi:hypothetical protein